MSLPERAHPDSTCFYCEDPIRWVKTNQLYQSKATLSYTCKDRNERAHVPVEDAVVPSGEPYYVRAGSFAWEVCESATRRRVERFGTSSAVPWAQAHAQALARCKELNESTREEAPT